MIGRKLSHYLVEERLGEGGMGEVFRARDVALGRTVAIKLLPSRLSSELRRRLVREADNSRRLQHPGIATFFEAGEAEGETFIAMEYVRGDTLRDHLRAGPLTVPAAIAIASGLLEALGHAHAAGVIHRDIKPENIMITGENIAKLLDFGIARHLTEPESQAAQAATRLTDPQALLGTIGYMAPEQLQNEPADARADLFAVGAVLYEMLAGRPAFAGDSVPARVAATLFGDPSPLPDNAGDFAGVMRRSLARSREQRYASAAEFLRDLRRLGEGQAIPAYLDTLAVLDFDNRSGDPGDDWIGGGIADSLAVDLGRFSDIGIAPRARVLNLAAESGAAGPAATGARLGCRWVLSGSYQRMGPGLRVFMDLTHVPTERVASSEKLDGRMDEIFALQDALGQKAAESLRLRERHEEPAPKIAPGLGAYECYTRGRQMRVRLTKGSFDQAQELFEEALRLQPDYVDALAGLAVVHDMRFTFTTDVAELEKAVGHARRAVALAPGHADAHVWLAYGLWRRGEIREAIAMVRRAAVLDPANAYPLYIEACIELSRGDPASALPLYQGAIRNAPGFGFAWVGLGNAHMDLGNASEAMWSLGRGIELEQGVLHATAGAAGYLAECLRRQGRLVEARAHCLLGLEAVERTDHMYRDSFRAISLIVLGRTALDQDDRDAARTAFHQCSLHLGGRPRTLGGGHLITQALAGLATVDRSAAPFRDASERFERRDSADWSWLWLCSDDVTRQDLARAAAVI